MRAIGLSILAGVFFAGDLTSWHHAIGAVGAGLATVLGNLSVLVVGLAAWLLFGERPSRTTILALPVVLAGVVLISGLVGSGAYGSNPPLGVGLGLVTAFCYAGYLLVIRRGGSDIRRPAGPVAIATASTAATALVAGSLLGEMQLAPSWPTHGFLALYGLTSQSLGYLLISLSLPRLPAVLTSIILLVQPVATVVLARIILDEVPSGFQIAGVGLVIIGVAIATVPFRRLRQRAPAATVQAGPGGMSQP
jgi:drug/metabolite transporter (DMT)-like permease